MSLEDIFKAYDVRGKYPDEITDEIAYKAGLASAVFFKAPQIAVGRDMRVSSENLAKNLMRGIIDAGVDVLDIGLVSTDAIYYAAGEKDMPGIMVTASHNPPAYGGMKFCRAGALPVSIDTGLADIRNDVERGSTQPAKKKGVITHEDILDGYAEKLLSFIDPAAFKPLKIVVDAGNGMGGKVVPKAFGDLPTEIIPMYFELDGTFPNHLANPLLPEATEDAKKRVVAESADIGIIFDGDADRAFFVDEHGAIIPSSLICALVAKAMLKKEPGATILYNVVCSKIVPETIEKYGGKSVMERVGHSFIKDRMRADNVLFGGEHSGHYYYRDNYFADSGLLTALIVVELLSKEGKPFSELMDEFKKYSAIDETNIEVVDKVAVIKKLTEASVAVGGKILQEYDGVSIDFGDYWFNVRPSNTEPLLRLNLEADTPELRDEKAKEVEEQIQQSASEATEASEVTEANL